MRHRRVAAVLLTAALLAATLLAGCRAPVATNVPLTLEGRPAGVAGQPYMTITEDSGGARATAAVGGQYYFGALVRESREVWVPVREVKTYRDSQGRERQRVVQHQELRRVYGPRARGLLTSGSSGDTLDCAFHLDHPAWGFSQGGVAECEASDGTRVVARF